MVADHRYHQLSWLHNYLSLALSPIQWMVDTPVRLIEKMDSTVSSHQALINENQQLKEEQIRAHVKLQKLIALEAENNRLRSLLGATPHSGETYVVAEVLRVDVDPFNQRIIIDKGDTQGVELGQPVIDADGIIGAVMEVYPNSSKVILLSDAAHGIPVENVRTGSRGIVIGTGTAGKLELQHVPNTVDLKENDTLVTSGLDGRFPPGYPVGTVKTIHHYSGESFVKVQVQPLAHIERSRQVLLIQRKEVEQQREMEQRKESESF